MKIAITGSIGVGKSRVFDILKSIYTNSKFIDLDEITKNIYQNLEVKEFLMENFNTSNKEEISNIVFNDKEKLDILSTFMQKIILKIMQNEIINRKEEMVFIDVPLLFESKWEKYFDEYILVYSSKKTQLKRLMNRNSIDENEALKRINSQIDIEEKRKISKYIIYNDKDGYEDLYINILDVLSKIIKERKC